MLKVGDTVVCINPSMNGYYDSRLNHVYRVDFITHNQYFYGYDISENENNRKSTLLNENDFLPLSYIRKLKIEKICTRLEI